MSNTVLVIGPSGTGKSTAIRTLDPKSTFIISILDKPLPFKGYKKLYKSIQGWDDKEGNYLVTDDWQRIIKCIQMIDKLRPDITTIIIDDFNYLMANEFMRRACEKGFDRFSEIAQHAWLVINAITSARQHLTCFVMSHSDIDQNGKSKCKTVGKMLDDKISLEGLFVTVLHTRTLDNQYLFLTQSDNEFTAKSPIGLFDEVLIENDLNFVKNKLNEYFN